MRTPFIDVLMSKLRSGALKEPIQANSAEVLRRDLQRLPSAHRQARHGAMLAVGERSERRVDRRDQIGDDSHLRTHWESGIAGWDPARCRARLGCVAGVHDDDHRLGLAGGDEVVEDQVGAALLGPARWRSRPRRAAGRARDNGSSCCCRSRAACRRGPPPGAGDFGLVQPQPDLAVRDAAQARSSRRPAQALRRRSFAAPAEERLAARDR